MPAAPIRVPCAIGRDAPLDHVWSRVGNCFLRMMLYLTAYDDWRIHRVHSNGVVAVAGLTQPIIPVIAKMPVGSASGGVGHHCCTLPTADRFHAGRRTAEQSVCIENLGECDHEPERRKLRYWLRFDGSIAIRNESRHPLPLSGLRLCTLNRGTMLLSLTPSQP